MENPELSQFKTEKKKGIRWVKQASAITKKPKKFSVPEGKRVLKMLEKQGLQPSAIEVSPDGAFCIRCVVTKAQADEPLVGDWDKELFHGKA